MAAKTAIEFLETIRDLHFIVGETNRRQLSTGGCNSCIHHALRFVLQLRNSGVFGCIRSGIRLGLAAVGAFLAAKRGCAGLADLIMHRPGYCTVATVVLIAVIVCVAGSGNGLRTGGAHLPAASVDTAARFGWRHSDLGTIYLLTGFQLLFIGVDREGQVKATAGGLRRGRPVCGIVFGVGHVRDIRTATFLRNLFAYNGNDLPGIPGRRVIDIGIVSVFARVSSGLAISSLLGQLLGRSTIGLGGQAIRIVGHDPQLNVIVVAICCVCSVFTLQTVSSCRRSAVLFFQQVQRKLSQPAPYIDLVRIVVTGRILTGFQPRHIRKTISWATRGLAIQTMAAAVSLHAVKPNQPRSTLEADRGDLTGGKRGCGSGSIGAGYGIRRGFRGCFALAQFHLQGLAQFSAIRRTVAKLH